MSSLRIARTIVRLLELPTEPTDVALDIADPDVRSAVESLLTSAGARVTTDVAGVGVVYLASPPAPLVPADARALVERVAPGGRVVVGFATCPHNPAYAASFIGPSFDLTHVHGESGEAGAVILRGVRRATPGKEQVKSLRGQGHRLEATVLVGREGLTAGLVASARDALARHGLIKARLTPQCKLDKDEASRDLAWAAGGQLVQRVGKMSLLYRSDVPLKPPVSRRA